MNLASREWGCLIVAAALHVAMAGTVVLRHPHREPLDEFVELTLLPVTAEPSTQPTQAPDGDRPFQSARTTDNTPTRRAAASISLVVPAAPTSSGEVIAAPTGAAYEQRTTESSTTQGDGAVGGVGAPLSGDALGIGRNPFLLGLPEQGDAGAGAGAQTRKVIIPLIDHAREASLGFAPDGPARTELAQATRLGRTPVNGRATFRVSIDSSRFVTHVDVAEYTDARDAWEEVARAAEVALAGRPMRLPSTSRGAILIIEITSQLQSPSGRPVRQQGPGGGGVTMHGDATELGARAIRVVHTRLLDWREPG